MENYAHGLQAKEQHSNYESPNISKHKQRLNLAKNFHQSPKNARPRDEYSDFQAKTSTQNSQVFDDKKKLKKYSKSSNGSQVQMQQSMSK